MKIKVDESLFDDKIKMFLEEMSKGLNLPPALIIQNIILKRLAEEAAEEAVFGDTGEKPLDEFMIKTINGKDYLLTGQELFNNLYDIKKQEFVKEKKDQILQEQAGGIPISKEDQDFIDNN